MTAGTYTPPTFFTIHFQIFDKKWHYDNFLQVICAELMKTWGTEGFAAHVGEVQQFYKDQRNKMLTAADKHLTGLGKVYFRLPF